MLVNRKQFRDMLAAVDCAYSPNKEAGVALISYLPAHKLCEFKLEMIRHTIIFTVPATHEGDLETAMPVETLKKLVRASKETDMLIEAGTVDGAACLSPIPPQNLLVGIRTATPVSEFTTTSDRFKAIVSSVVKAVCDDETRYFMLSIHFSGKNGKFEAVATDGRRLHLDTPVGVVYNDTLDHNITVAGCKLPNRLVPGYVFVEVSAVHNKVTYRADGGLSYVIITAPIDGQFPNYTRVIPSSFDTRHLCNAKALRDILIEARQRTDKKNGRAVYLEFLGGVYNRELWVKVRDEAGGIIYNNMLEIIAKNEQPKDKIFRLNVDYMIDALENVPFVYFELNTPDNSVVLKPVGSDDWLRIVMPMRL